jgi:hypothetical protein
MLAKFGWAESRSLDCARDDTEGENQFPIVILSAKSKDLLFAGVVKRPAEEFPRQDGPALNH